MTTHHTRFTTRGMLPNDVTPFMKAIVAQEVYVISDDKEGVPVAICFAKEDAEIIAYEMNKVSDNYD